MSMIKDAFWNSQEDRQKPLWRIVTTTAVIVGMVIGANIITQFAFGNLSGDPAYTVFARNLIMVMAATAGIYIGRTQIDKKSLISLGLDLKMTALKDFAFGLLVSLIMIAIFFGLQISFDLIAFESITLGGEDGIGASSIIFVFLGMGLFVSWLEEVYFRGIVFQNLEEGLGLKIAVVLSCLLYACLHMVYAHATWLTAAIIALIGGMRLLAYLRTRQLWFSIGLHTSWNFCLLMFGYKIFGNSISGALEHKALEPTWLSGGEFGPEASFLIVPVALLAMAAIMWWSEDRLPKDQSTDMEIDAPPTSAP